MSITCWNEAPRELLKALRHINVTAVGGIVAICYRGRERQAIPILELPLPDPPPAGWEWIESYRRWSEGR